MLELRLLVRLRFLVLSLGSLFRRAFQTRPVRKLRRHLGAVVFSIRKGCQPSELSRRSRI